FALNILFAIILWAGYLIGLVPFSLAVGYSVIALPLLCASYALQRFAGTRLTPWRGIFIVFSAICIGFVLWYISVIILTRVFGLGGDPAALISLLAYPLGAYLGDKLGKRINYMPWCR
ncbi:unnamed protein product, partial [marine sediment metagenome]